MVIRKRMYFGNEAGNFYALDTKDGDIEWEAQLAAGLPLVLGGRSSGARVACRTAQEVGADAVLCLAFTAYGASSALHASGFAAIYVAALILGNSELPHRVATEPAVPGMPAEGKLA